MLWRNLGFAMGLKSMDFDHPLAFVCAVVVPFSVPPPVVMATETVMFAELTVFPFASLS